MEVLKVRRQNCYISHTSFPPVFDALKDNKKIVVRWVVRWSLGHILTCDRETKVDWLFIWGSKE
jgi:hypothetical protein